MEWFRNQRKFDFDDHDPNPISREGEDNESEYHYQVHKQQNSDESDRQRNTYENTRSKRTLNTDIRRSPRRKESRHGSGSRYDNGCEEDGDYADDYDSRYDNSPDRQGRRYDNDRYENERRCDKERRKNIYMSMHADRRQMSRYDDPRNDRGRYHRYDDRHHHRHRDDDVVSVRIRSSREEIEPLLQDGYDQSDHAHTNRESIYSQRQSINQPVGEGEVFLAVSKADIGESKTQSLFEESHLFKAAGLVGFGGVGMIFAGIFMQALDIGEQKIWGDDPIFSLSNKLMFLVSLLLLTMFFKIVCILPVMCCFLKRRVHQEEEGEAKAKDLPVDHIEGGNYPEEGEYRDGHGTNEGITV